MRTRFDQFAKQMAGQALAAGGTVRTDEEVSPDAGHIDIWFTPHETSTSDGGEVTAPQALAPLGMLGRMAREPFTMEPFHRTPDGQEVMGVVCKHHHFRSLLSRHPPAPATAPAATAGEATVTAADKAAAPAAGFAAAPAPRRRGKPASRNGTPGLPVQWIVSSGRPELALKGLRFDRKPAAGWGPGVYKGPPLTHTRLVVVAELPATRDTLLLRLMGAGRVLARALKELRGLPEDAPERALAIPLVVGLRIEIANDPAKRTEDDEEYIMAMQSTLDTYIEQWKSDGRQEGRQLGRQEGLDDGACRARRHDLLGFYKVRLGAPPADVAAIIARTNDPELLAGWLTLAFGGSVEDVTTAIRTGAPGVARPAGG